MSCPALILRLMGVKSERQVSRSVSLVLKVESDLYKDSTTYLAFTSMVQYILLLYKAKKIYIMDWTDLCSNRELQVCSKAKFRRKTNFRRNVNTVI
jgi:hypothetical protein